MKSKGKKDANSEDFARSFKRKKRRKRIILSTLFTFLAVLAIGITVYGAYLFYKAENVVSNSQEELKRGTKSELREKGVDPSSDNFSMLILGVDDSESRKTYNGGAVRSDAMVLLTFNRTERSIHMLSIPRDTYTYIPAVEKFDKITHAYAFGGADESIKSVEELLGIPVDYYTTINFDAFLAIVDAIGGIDVDVPVSFTEQNSRDEGGTIHLEKGFQHLNAEQALALARTRHIDSDIERGKRQQLIIEAIMKQTLTFKNIARLGSVMDAVGGNMKTNFTFDNMLAMFDYAKDGGLPVIEKHTITGDDAMIHGIYYYKPHLDSVKSLKEILSGHLGITPMPSKYEVIPESYEKEEDATPPASEESTTEPTTSPDEVQNPDESTSSEGETETPVNPEDEVEGSEELPPEYEQE